jgi:prefoldin subunit 2
LLLEFWVTFLPSASLVLETLTEALAEDPDRKCFRLVGGVLAERTVKDVVPALQINRDNVCTTSSRWSLVPYTTISQIKTAVSGLAEQYRTREDVFESFKREYNIRPATRS